MTSPLPVPRPSAQRIANAQAAFLSLLPHGGQRTARRNAWSAMVDNSSESRTRSEADAALADAAARARRQQATFSR